jgi:hypothetical protein
VACCAVRSRSAGPSGSPHLRYEVSDFDGDECRGAQHNKSVWTGGQMSNVEQFEKVVTEAGAKATRIERGHNGAERLIIETPGGLVTREVPLKGDFGKDIQEAKAAAQQIVASARSLTANPSRNLSTSGGHRKG